MEICEEGDAEYVVGRFGTSGRNTLTSPGDATVDFSVQKNFQVSENHSDPVPGRVLQPFQPDELW
jgi:hypothetical protein